MKQAELDKQETKIQKLQKQVGNCSRPLLLHRLSLVIIVIIASVRSEAEMKDLWARL